MRGAAVLALRFLKEVACTSADATAVWTYKVTPDLKGNGVGSVLTAPGDDSIMFTTATCIYSGSGTCINSTGQLMKLKASTGEVEWGYRFDGAGMSVADFPSPPSFVPKTKLTPTLAVVLGAQARDTHSGMMGYFAAGVPLPGVDRGATRFALKKAASPRKVTRVGYQRGSSLPGGWQTPRPGPDWTSLPAAVATGAEGEAYIVVMAKCDKYPAISDCGVEAFNAKGTATGRGGTSILWQYPLAADCNEGTKACMCKCGNGACVSDPVIGDGGVFLQVCDSRGVVLLALDLHSGTELWEPVRLADQGQAGGVPNAYPALVFSSRFNMVISGLQLPNGHNAVHAVGTKTGTLAWSLQLQDPRCTSMRWTDVGVLTPDGQNLLLWEDFNIRTVSTATGEPVWSSTGYSAAGRNAPGVSFASASFGKADVALVSANDAPNNCDAAFEPGIFVQAINLTDGSFVGRAMSPSSQVLAAALPPVGVRDLWIYTEADPDPPRMTSTIYALRTNYTKD